MPATVAIEALALGTPPQGIGSYCLHLVSALAASPGDFEYLVFLPREGLPYFRHLAGPRVRLIPCSFPGRRWGRVAYQHLIFPSRLCDYGNPLLHSVANLLPWRHRGPAIVTVHDLDFLMHPAFSPPPRRWLFGLLTPVSLRKAAVVIAISSFTAGIIRQRYPDLPPDRIRVLPHGAPPRRTVEDSRLHEILAGHGLRQPYFLAVGTLEMRKNIPLVIEAFERFRRLGGAPVRLVLVGLPGYGYAGIAETIRRSPFRREITQTGYVPAGDLPALYAGASGLLFLSNAEGFGLPALEAQSLGCPVIAARAGALPETCGAGAVLVNPGDPDEAAAAMALVAGDEERRGNLIEAGWRNLGRFSWVEHAVRLQEIYRELSADRR